MTRGPAHQMGILTIPLVSSPSAFAPGLLQTHGVWSSTLNNAGFKSRGRLARWVASKLVDWSGVRIGSTWEKQPGMPRTRSGSDDRGDPGLLERTDPVLDR